MSKRNTIFTTIILVMILSGTLVYRHVQDANAASQVQYRTATVEKGDVTDAVEASGVVQPLTTVDIKSRAGGPIIKLAVDVGSVVKPGSLIARIDPTDTQSAYNQAEADLITARARLAQAQEQASMQATQNQLGVSQSQDALASAQAKLIQAQQQARVQPALTDSAIRQAQADLASAQQQYQQLSAATDPQARASARSTLDQAQANVVAADAAYNRQYQLVQKGFVAQQSVDTALAARDVARATLVEAKQRMQTIDADQKAAQEAAAARVQLSKAALQAAQTNSYQIAARQQDVVANQAALRQAQAAVQNAQASLIQSQMRQQDIQAAKDDVAKAQAQVDNTKVQLKDATIYAPRAGVILLKYVEQGTIITSGESLSSTGTAIVQLGDISHLYIDVSVDESDIEKIHLGQKVLIALDAAPDISPQGHVVRIDPQAVDDRDVTTIHARVEIENPGPQIKPGMNATCQFILRDVRGVLVVPSDAVKEDRQGANTVRVVSKDNHVVAQPVVVGVVGSDKTEIKQGLQPGDRVVLGTIQPPGGGSPAGGGALGS